MSYRLSNIFREQARRSLDEVDQHGAPLRLTPAWIGWTYWLLVAVGTTSLILAALTDIGEYAQGPAMIRLLGRTQIGAVEPGVVAQVVVEPGQRVATGEVLIRLDDAAERAELQRLDAELQGAMVEFLRHPADDTERAELAGLRAERTQADARVEQRVIRAPHEGVMSDARVSPGQHVEAGEILLTLVGPEARRELVAALPGHYRPLLQAGMTLHLELTGYENHAQPLKIEVVGDEVIGPAAVERLLGQDRADTLTIAGPAVLIRAQLSDSSFEAGSHRYPYFDGMAGTVEVRVRSQSVLTTLIPGLRELSERQSKSEP
jgi:multidrug efflux pump subunit AcrA (membrane-fusion protein)